MSFTRFSEYLEKTGKLQKKAIVDLHGDTAPPSPNKPGKAATSSKKGHWHTEAAVVDDDNGPFKYQGDGKDPGLQMAGDGPEKSPPLGSRDVPQSGMVYHPKTDPAQNLNVDIDQFTQTKSVNFKANEPAKTVDSAPPKPPRPFNKAEKNTTENFLAQTSKLSPEKYAEYILSKNDVNTVKEAISLGGKISKDTDLLETFVREVKRKGGFDKLMEVILNQPEAYAEFALAIAADEGRAKKVAKALSETTAPPAVDDEDEEPKPNTSGIRPKDKIIPKEASTLMPPGDQGGVDSRGKPAKMMRPEHALIQALAGYKNIRSTMQEVLG